MKKIIMLAPLMVLFFMSSVYADGISVKVPASQMGPEASVNYAGIKAKIISSEVETLISSNSCVLFGIFASSVTTGPAYVIFRDTDKVDLSGTQTVSTFHIGASASSSNITLPFPVRFAKGLTAILTKVTSTPNTVTILYMDTDVK